MKYAAFLFALCLALPVAAQSPLVVMNLAAHPDDEDGRTLTYYRHAKDAVAYSVIFTRGEGGQNEIGPELYEALGAIRTAETENAARHLGTQVNFLNFKDFGYSKHADEAFALWGGRDLVTARLVYLIRKLKPDVLFTNHDTLTVGPRTQHGQHQAVGIAGYDAFALAADPAFHPEQLEEAGVDLWQPKRMFLRLWFGTPVDTPNDVAVPVGAADPATGAPYLDRAVAAIHEHASQGMGAFASRMRADETTRFVLVRSATDAPLGPDDLAAHLPPNTAAAPSLAYRIDAGYVPALSPRLLTLDDDLVIPGQRVTLRWSPDALPMRRVRWVFTGAVDTTLYLSDTSPGIATLRVHPNAAPTIPKPVRQYDRFTNAPPVQYALYRAGTDSLLAAGYLAMEVGPPATLSFADDVVRLLPGANAIPFHAELFDPAIASLDLNLAVSRDADRTVIHQVQFRRATPASVFIDTLAFNLPAPLAAGDYTLTLTALPAPTLRAPAPVRAHATGRVFAVTIAEGLQVGLVQSYDNTLARALEELGLTPVLLDSLALASAPLDRFHTIVVDIRAYLVRPDLRAHNDRLLDWVARGGHLVVNYQKTFEWNAQYDDPFVAGQKNPEGFAPYPLKLGRDRVTREDAPMTLLAPNDPLFHTPNALDEGIWDGWVQERGLYFPDAYDDRYRELFATSDPGEAPLKSSTLLAPHGDGTYLYTALVWYRQLKVFNPGAYAFFANLVSLPLVDGRAGALRTE